MKIGTINITDWLADDYTLPRPIRSTAAVDTMGGVAFFSWGIKNVGQDIDVNWDVMSKTLFDQLDALFVADAATTWEPDDGYVYTVEITNLSGQLITTFANAYRQKVRLQMTILGRAVIPA